jgi:hypothetical protein
MNSTYPESPIRALPDHIAGCKLKIPSVEIRTLVLDVSNWAMSPPFAPRPLLRNGAVQDQKKTMSTSTYTCRLLFVQCILA